MQFLKFKSVNSTNTWALENFLSLDDKTVVCADSQTNGRGRFDRSWVSGDYENIYATFVLKPDNFEHVVNLTQYLSVTVAKLVQTYGASARIKWPNDVLVENKKLCGILCESYRVKNKIAGVALGVGVNLNMPESVVKEIDRPATSLNLVLNKKIDKDEFLKQLVENFFDGYDSVLTKGFSYIRNEYMNNIDFLGKKVKIQQRDGAEIFECRAKDIDENGNLVVEKDGCLKIIYSGDLIL